jgi:threonine aldolase
MLELACAWKKASPSDTFLQLSLDCESLDINSQDLYGDFSLTPEESWLRRFEQEVAASLGYADAIFMPSGVMAQHIVLLVNDTNSDSDSGAGANVNANVNANLNTKSFIAHHSSHTVLEAGGVGLPNDAYETLLGFAAHIIKPNPTAVEQEPISYRDVEWLIGEARVAASTVVVECPHRELGGKCTSWAELVLISNLCRERGVKVHLDGARLWEAAVFYGRSYSEICGLFDTAYISFYKGLGGLTGAMLLGSRSVIEKSRKWLRRFGGNLYSLMPYAVSGWAGYRKVREQEFTLRRDKLRHVIEIITAAMVSSLQADAATETEGRSAAMAMVRFDPPIPDVSMVHVYCRGSVEQCLQARDHVMRDLNIKLFNRIIAGRFGATGTSYTELNMVCSNG